MRPKTYLFPGTRNGWRADKPITPKVIWEAVQHAARTAGIQKHVTPHTLRHCFATHMLQEGADLRTIQVLLGHKDIEATTRYLHVSPKRLQSATDPLGRIPVSGPALFERSRKLHKPE
jgi:site-specific recombinase XerD